MSNFFFNAEDSTEKSQFMKELTSLKSNFDESSWNPTKLDAFMTVFATSLKSILQWEFKVYWDRSIGEDGKKIIVCKVSTKEWGQISLDLPYDLIMSPTCPRSLPFDLAKSFKNKFDNKIFAISKKIEMLKKEQEKINKQEIPETQHKKETENESTRIMESTKENTTKRRGRKRTNPENNPQ